MDISRTTRLGAQQGLSLSIRDLPNKDETIAVSIWRQNGYNSILYNPWCSNKNAQVVHGHYHTSWARNIHFSWMGGFFLEMLQKFDEFKTLEEAREWVEDKAKAYIVGNNDLFKKPALFDWKGKTVYIVGRGSSVGKNVSVLNSIERKNPAVFVNTAYNDVDVQPVDYVMIADNRILGVEEYRGAIKAPLLSFPGIDRDIVGDNWSGLYGFVPWTRSPMNDFMREIFPHLPAALDILCVSVMATHLALLNNVKNIVYMGMDNTHKGPHSEKIKTKDINGEKCKTIKGYYEMQTACCQLAGFARFHCDTKFFNATGAGILGVNHFENDTLFPWITQISAKEAIERFESS